MNVYRKYQEMQEDCTIFSYVGLLNSDLIVHLMKLSDTALTMHGIKTKQKKSLINVIIEALQNMMYHTDTDTQRATDCVILLGRDPSAYSLLTGNYVLNDHIPALKSRLQSLAPMTVEQLNHHYLMTLDKEEISAKGGAGLGLIRIFMDSKLQTSFEFEQIDEHYSFFSMNIRVSA
jgi:hypothetical protein